MNPHVHDDDFCVLRVVHVRKPLRSARPQHDLAATRFLGQPRLTKWIRARPLVALRAMEHGSQRP